MKKVGEGCIGNGSFDPSQWILFLMFWLSWYGCIFFIVFFYSSGRVAWESGFYVYFWIIFLCISVFGLCDCNGGELYAFNLET